MIDLLTQHAYQVYGKKVSFNFINNIHKQILGKVKPDLTFILKLRKIHLLIDLEKEEVKIDMIIFL